MTAPTYNSEGQAVWKPQPGTIFPNGLRYAHSYGGVVAKAQDLLASQGGDLKAYPSNFAGIIAALEDLQKYLKEGELPNVGAPPPGWEIIINPDGSIDGDWQIKPPDGTLWFDTRQGRLFIAIDGNYVQTNGGDGIATVSPTPPTNPPVIGQTWLDTDTGLFYVYIGEGIWQAVISDGDITITTATLPLAIARSAFSTPYEPQIIPDLPSIDEMQVQKDYNTWLMEAMVNLDQAVTEGSIAISDTPPTENVVAGTLWYDSRTLELSIYYVDDDSEQWVPVSVGHEIASREKELQDQIDAEARIRATAIDNLYDAISSMDRVDDATVAALDVKLAALQTQVNSIEVPDVTPLATTASLANVVSRVSALEVEEVDLSGYATTTSLSAVHSSLLNTINSKTHLELSDITPLIPDVSDYVKQADIDSSIAGITTEYLPRSGGTVDGSFIINKSDISQPAFDVSSSWHNSKSLFKLSTYAPTTSTPTFGATENFWEVAWNFNGNEDFAWVYNDTDKVFSITKDGPACSQLYIGNFQENDANGRYLVNKIEVGQELRTHKDALEAVRQAVASSTDYETLKTGLLQALSNV